MFRKWCVVGIILLCIGAGIVPVFAEDSEKSQSISLGNWLYVGGDGPGNFTRIQEAIDNTSDGDTVFVYSGTYRGCITVYHEISVLGEDKDTTIIDGMETDDVVTIAGHEIHFSDFTIQNSTLFDGAGIVVFADTNIEISDVHVTDTANGIVLESGTGIFLHDAVINKNTEKGVFVKTYRSTLLNNTITDNRNFGIVLLGENVDDTVIKNNVISGQRQGIWVSDMYDTSQIEITENIIMNSSTYGVSLEATDSTIQGNQFYNNSIGVTLVSGQENDIRGNTFRNNTLGLWILGEGINRIHRNNFIQNEEDAFFSYFLFTQDNRNHWYHNYWDSHQLPLPKLIRGQKIFPFPYSWGNISWMQFDIIPALSPYDIPQLR